MKCDKKSIWITWENQIRNKSMSARLGADFFPIIDNGSRLVRYCKSTAKTLRLLYANRDKTVFVQNPSIVLSFVAVLFKSLFGIKLIVDAHNSGVFPAKKLQGIADFINKRADYVIVTNEGLANYIRKIGGSPIVLPDPLPEIPVINDESSPWVSLKSPCVLMICSWASDEPYCEVISAAAALPDVTFYITGNSKGREAACNFELPSNVVLTGFVSENDYHLLLNNADIIVDLTTREDCLVCGAYEAIAVGKPVVLSNTSALRNYFADAAIYVDNHSASIVDGIRNILRSYDEVSAKAKSNSQEVEKQWLQLFGGLQKLLS